MFLGRLDRNPYSMEKARGCRTRSSKGGGAQRSGFLLGRKPALAGPSANGTPSWPKRRVNGAPAGLGGPGRRNSLARDRQRLTFDSILP